MVAVIPVASMAAANASLEAQGFGPRNFSVPAFTGYNATHAALHAWTDVAFQTAVLALAGVVTEISDGDPVARTQALIAAQGATWGDQAQALPEGGDWPSGSHPVTAGQLLRYGTSLWYVIQSHNRAVYGGDPAQYPALLRRVRNPAVVELWHQPLDQFDSYRTTNPFVGHADECLWTDGKVYRTKIDFNTYSPAGYPAGWQLQ
jgi:hypothetical protein